MVIVRKRRFPQVMSYMRMGWESRNRKLFVILKEEVMNQETKKEETKTAKKKIEEKAAKNQVLKVFKGKHKPTLTGQVEKTMQNLW